MKLTQHVWITQTPHAKNGGGIQPTNPVTTVLPATSTRAWIITM